MSGLQERLHRLRRGPVLPPPLHPDLARLESDLLGSVAEELSLKERLQRLVAAASRSRRSHEPHQHPPAVPLEELVAGRRVANERGEFFLVEGDIHLDVRHGSIPLSRFRALPPASVAVLAGERGLEGFDFERAVFLDTETTGLAGGTGTAAFLIGIGFLEGDRFRVKQYFMRDYHEEAALLHGLAEDLRRFRHLVTFNGRIFDVPLLESRYRLNRGRFPLQEAEHLDLLHPARRLWKLRLESCRLQSLEAALLGLQRQDDVAGEEIPQIYFDFVRRRDARAMARVLDHNRVDIVSLAALAVLACQWVQDGAALCEDPRDVYCLGRVLERAQLYDRSEEQYRRLAEGPAGPLRGESLMRLAARAKRVGRHAEAAGLWRRAAEEGQWLAFRELAIHHEHRSGDLPAALWAVEEGLDRLRTRPEARRVAEDFRRRRARIQARLQERVPVTTEDTLLWSPAPLLPGRTPS